MKKEVKKLAESHVNWFLAVIKPLLVTHFIHGYKHGKEAQTENLKDEA